MTQDRVFEIKIPSARKNVALVEPFLLSIEAFRELEESKYYNALIAVTEAVNNAILHGNKCDESKIVDVIVEVIDEGLLISVRDQGAGFDPNTVPDPRRKENILKDGGRGVFLIHSLVDEAKFVNLEQGMLLQMFIKVDHDSDTSR